MTDERLNILGVNVSRITGVEFLRLIDDTVRAKSKAVFAYVNVHGVNLAGKLPWFREFLNSAPVTYTDGEGIRLGAAILGSSLPETIALTRKMWDVASLCEKNGYALYLFGATEENARKAEAKLKAQYPNLKIKSHHGYCTAAENDMVINDINAHSTDVLIIGLGMPKQEEWIRNTIGQLNVNVILTGGSCIDYTAGAKTVCPGWIARAGFEWLFRFFMEPGRLFARYFIGNPVFLMNVLIQRMKEGKKHLSGFSHGTRAVL